MLRVGEDGEGAVGFQDGVLDLLGVQHVLLPQVAHQLVQGDPGLAQPALQNPPVFNEDHRLAAENLSESKAAQGGPGQHQLQPQHRQNGHQAGKQRDAPILHGDGGQVGHQHGHHEFRRLHLPDLPLAHEPHHQNQHQIQHNGAEIG